MNIILGVEKQGSNLNLDFLWQTLGASSPIDGFDLYLAPNQPHQVLGLDQSLIAGVRHDDLAMVYATLKGICLAAQERKLQKTALACFFDAEETGSLTTSGAHSNFLNHILSRILAKQNTQRAKKSHLSQALSKSFLISADMAHALHPGYEDKHDSNNKPVINQGIVLKENANDRYASSGESLAIAKGLCEAAATPYQTFVSRQDLRCGSTVGPILASQLGCQTVDLGMAMGGMHSICETMGTEDMKYAIALFERFFYFRKNPFFDCF